jgi:precorrin-6B methylase 2
MADCLLLLKKGKVYAIEKNEKAVSLLEMIRDKFILKKLELI